MPVINCTAKVPVEAAGTRLDKVAAALFTDYSRTLVKGWIEGGQLRVDGDVWPVRRAVTGGERLTLIADAPEEGDWQSPQPIDLDVVYEDEVLLVVNKPAGLVVHPGAGRPDGTLVNALLAHRPGLRALPRAGIVHRLDKDTSGLLLVAADLAARTQLTAAMAERRIERSYVALAEGVLAGARTIDAPIGRHPTVRTRQAVIANGKPATTHVRPLKTFERHTWLSARLDTGRTHQIRVHLAHIGHPLVGDSRYGARGLVPSAAGTEVASALRRFTRQALHAIELSFIHPATGRRLTFNAPVPDDLSGLLDQLCGGNR